MELPGAKVPGSESSMELSLMELSLPGAKVPRSESSSYRHLVDYFRQTRTLDDSYDELFVRWTIRTMTFRAMDDSCHRPRNKDNIAVIFARNISMIRTMACSYHSQI